MVGEYHDVPESIPFIAGGSLILRNSSHHNYRAFISAMEVVSERTLWIGYTEGVLVSSWGTPLFKDRDPSYESGKAFACLSHVTSRQKCMHILCWGYTRLVAWVWVKLDFLYCYCTCAISKFLKCRRFLCPQANYNKLPCIRTLTHSNHYMLTKRIFLFHFTDNPAYTWLRGRCTGGLDSQPWRTRSECRRYNKMDDQ